MILQQWKTKEDVELRTPKELREFLTMCNPTILKFYISQLEVLKPYIKVEGIGTGIKLLRRNNEK